MRLIEMEPRFGPRPETDAEQRRRAETIERVIAHLKRAMEDQEQSEDGCSDN